MNTVNELKKLLRLDLEKRGAKLLREASTLESLNRQSEALNQLVLSGGGGDDQEDQEDAGKSDDDDDDCQIVYEGGSTSPPPPPPHPHPRQKGLELIITPGVDGTRVKSFEDLVNIKLQQQGRSGGGEAEQQHQQLPQKLLRQSNPFKVVQSAEKRPFLRRGEGLRRFSQKEGGEGEMTSPKTVGNHRASKTATTTITLSKERPLPPRNSSTNTTTTQAIKAMPRPKNCEVITEKLAGSEQPLLRREDVTERCTKKRTDFTRKVLPISRTQSQQKTAENGFSTIATSSQAGPKLSTVEVVRQIGHLEKRLLDLMTLKGQLTEERTIFDRDHLRRETTPENSASQQQQQQHLASSIELIRGEIAALNSKVSSMATTTTIGKRRNGDEVKEEDKNSRHLETEKKEEASRATSIASATLESTAAELSSNNGISTSSTTTLSNGDKIAFASDQSITYVHVNGTSQTLYRDGLRVIRFPNGQIERHHPDGSKEITYAADQQQQLRRRLLIKSRRGDGGGDGGRSFSEEIIHLADGTVHSTTTADGCQRTLYPNGDVEWRTEDYTRRHFSSGHIKTQYANGCSETIFSNGRVRLKDSQGNVLFDQKP